MKDWIEYGTLSLYYLRVSNVAQSGVSHSGHPMMRRVLLFLLVSASLCSSEGLEQGFLTGL